MSEKMAKHWFKKASDILMTAPNPIGVTPKDLRDMIKKASPGGLTRANLQILGFHPHRIRKFIALKLGSVS